MHGRKRTIIFSPVIPLVTLVFFRVSSKMMVFDSSEMQCNCFFFIHFFKTNHDEEKCGVEKGNAFPHFNYNLHVTKQ